MKKFQDLYEFVEKAVKSRKYSDNTGLALKSALKLFEKELNEEEQGSIDIFRKNLDQIYQSVFSKQKDFSASSLATYKSRVQKVLNDYENYGIDANKMVNWSPKKPIPRAKKQSSDKEDASGVKNYVTDSSSSHIFDFSGGIKLFLPKTPKINEAIMDGELKKIKIELKEFSEKFVVAEVNNEKTQ